MQELDQLVRRAADLLIQAEYAVAMTGAGHSTPSGIPDFRSPDSGLWTHVDPLAVASLFAFRLRPRAFYDWIRPLARVMLQAQPNPAHYALAQLEAAGLLKSVITQNIDGLHQKAGSNRVHEVHGHIREATCIRCYQVVPADDLIAEFVAVGEVPRCTCGGVLKPNVILFGEQLPLNVLTAARQDTRDCDLMLVIGSSLTVEPVADLPLMALGHGARLVIINYERTHLDKRADVLIHADLAEVMPRIAREAINSLAIY
jgi:NAD-dependent deacetylase